MKFSSNQDSSVQVRLRVTALCTKQLELLCSRLGVPFGFRVKRGSIWGRTPKKYYTFILLLNVRKIWLQLRR